MQRIAALVLCAALWGPNASAQTCTTIAAIISGFTGGATGYGMTRYIGPASNWVSAGLYGAGMAASALGANELARGACEHMEAIMKATAEIYCFSGEYLCESIEDVARSMARDFEICSECTVDEVIGSFPMADRDRERHLVEMQTRRGGPPISVRVIARSHVVGSEGSNQWLDSYFAGLQATYEINRFIQRQRQLN